MSTEVFRFGNVMCFALYSDQRKSHPLKKEMHRFVVLSSETHVEGYPTSYQLYFYKNEEKCRDRSPLYKEPLSEKLFCGLIKGTKNSKTKDVYIALMFTTFTLIITLPASDYEKSPSIVESCKSVFEELFGKYKSCSIKFSNYPSTEKKRFVKEATGSVLLSITKYRASICSETFFHICLYSWLHSDVRIEFEPPNIQLSVRREASHPGEYKFYSTRCIDLKDCLSQIIGVNIYEPVMTSQASSKVWNQRVSSSSLSSQGSAPLPSPRNPGHDLSWSDVSSNSRKPSNASSKHCMSSTSSGSVFELEPDINGIYITAPSSVSDDDLEFSFDVNDYVTKNGDSIKEVLTSISQSSPSEPFSPGTASRNSLDVTHVAMKPTSLQSLVFSESDDFSSLSRFFDVCERFCFWVKQRCPGRDTLDLSPIVRFRVCTRLYLETCRENGCSKEDWEILAEEIGLSSTAIRLIKIVIQRSFLPYPAAEIVIRHWQFMYNRYGTTGPSGKCPVACTRQELVNILNKLRRLDLVQLISSEQQEQ